MAAFNHTYRQTPGGGIFYGWLESMHSRFDILVSGLGEEAASAATAEISGEVARLHRRLNRFDQSSDIYALNTLTYYNMFHTDPELLSILDDALRYKEISAGTFDICLQTPGYDNSVDYYSVDYASEAVVLNTEGVIFDLGGYAKGYALGKAADILRRHGAVSAMMSFGGSSVYAIGEHPSGGNWQVGVENPFIAKDRVALFGLHDEAMSSSGNSPRNTGHIKSTLDSQSIDTPRIISVSGPSPLECEVISTALFAAGDDAELRDKVLEGCAAGGIGIKRAVEINFTPTYDTLSVRELI